MVVRGLGLKAHGDSGSRLEASSVQGSRLKVIRGLKLEAL